MKPPSYYKAILCDFLLSFPATYPPLEQTTAKSLPRKLVAILLTLSSNLFTEEDEATQLGNFGSHGKETFVEGGGSQAALMGFCIVLRQPSNGKKSFFSGVFFAKDGVDASRELRDGFN